jgi:WD40 repeat protein
MSLESDATLAGTPLSPEAKELLGRFDSLWQTPEKPRIDDFLLACPENERLAVLVELAHSDLEFRLRAGEPARVEDYLRRYPELAARPAVVANLLAAEFRLRCRRDPSYDPADYLCRFPEHAALIENLAGECAAVATTIHPVAPPVQQSAAEAAAPETTELPGYELLGELGRGGMGIVYKARQVRLNRLVAVKMILHAEYTSAEERRRFVAEAQALGHLQHPHIVQIHDVGEHNGVPYFSLEFCPGGSLADKLDGTPWEARPAAELVQTLAGAGHAAHQAGWVHRDLKPGNVLLAADGTPKVTDFGLVKRLDVPGHTQSGAVVGTPAYMAPEQAAGRRSEVGPAADVYALGAILYELLTGRPPFKAATALDTVLQVLSEEPVAVRRLQPKTPRDLETICHKCLEKEPGKRYASAAALAEDLGRFLAGEPVRARPVGTLGRLAKWGRRRPAVAALMLVVAAVTVAGLTGILWAYGKAVEQREVAQGEAENARQEKQRADDRAAEAERQTYLAQIGRAEAQLLAGEHVGALQVLDRTSQEQRGWEYRYFRQRAEGTPLTLRGHTKWVYSVAFSPDGSRLASGSWDNTVKVWDARNGAEVATLRGHTAQVFSVAFSPDGSRLATASGDKTAKLWDARTGAELTTLGGDAGPVVSVCFSPDGARLASAAQDNTVKVWDTRSGTAVATLRGHTNPVLSVAFSPDGSRIASGDAGAKVKVWDARSGTEVCTLRGHTFPVYTVAFSPDSTRIASGSMDTTMKVWDAHDGAALTTFRGHTHFVTSVCYSPDGVHIASASLDQTVKVTDARSGAEVATLRGHTDRVLSVAYSPDGSRLASGSGDNTVKLWDVASGAEVPTFRGHQADVWCVACSPDGKRIASASGDLTIKVWDTRTAVAIATLRGHTRPLTSLCYSPDGSRLVSSSWDGTVRVWDAHSGTEVATLSGHTSVVACVACSADGRRIAGGGGDKTVRVWDAESGAEVATLRGHTEAVIAVKYSPDGGQIASGAGDSTVKVWDATSGAEVATLRGHTQAVWSVAYSPDGRRIASASADNTVKVWDAKSGARLANLRGHTDSVVSVCFSPDGSRIATGSWDKTVKVWDASSGALIATLHGHTNWVNSVAFSPDGSRIVSGSKDKTVRVWDTRSQAEVAGVRQVLVWDGSAGKLLPDEAPPEGSSDSNASPAGRHGAVPDGDASRIRRRQPGAGDYDPWAEDQERRGVHLPLWHAEEAAAAEKRGDTFAAAFHRRHLALGDNLRLLAWARLADRDRASCLRTLRQMQQELVPRWQLSAALASGLPVQPTPGVAFFHAAVAALARLDEQRRAAVLVRAAALLSDSGIASADLVTLAHYCVKDDPQSFQCRELFGAALYRDDKAADAVRELQEAVRLQGQGGSLWAKLFLALAHQHLGHAQEAEQWRQKADRAGPWEEQVLQFHLLGELDAARRPGKP